mmetsp:Transcript_23235/g.59323  ORF Transcript_23235/g.59323 Transcript_23235/m.59323 type:complete len:670 (+) Transcript_23235:103-2112(+)
MGCAAAVQGKKGVHDPIKEQLERSERDLAEERRRLLEKDEQIAHVQSQLQTTEEATARQYASTLSAEQLRSELQAHHEESRRELVAQRDLLVEQHRTDLHNTRQERQEVLSRALVEKTQVASESVRAQELCAEKAHEALVRTLREAAECTASRHREEAECAEREVRRLRELCLPLRFERDEAAESLAEARASLRSEQEERANSAGRASSLERRLAEAQDERKRSEQRYEDLEVHLRAQMCDLQAELRARTEELQHRNALLKRREEELVEVNTQLCDLQGLFNDVNQQLQSECGRIEKLQDTVSLCARQTKELEQLEGMLEDAHRMLAQVRDALEEERAERVRAQGLLEHEQQRTQLLLDVLKHFKEKLQGLTPQVLLSRLGATGPEAKALLANLGAAIPADCKAGGAVAGDSGAGALIVGTSAAAPSRPASAHGAGGGRGGGGGGAFGAAAGGGRAPSPGSHLGSLPPFPAGGCYGGGMGAARAPPPQAGGSWGQADGGSAYFNVAAGGCGAADAFCGGFGAPAGRLDVGLKARPQTAVGFAHFCGSSQLGTPRHSGPPWSSGASDCGSTVLPDTGCSYGAGALTAGMACAAGSSMASMSGWATSEAHSMRAPSPNLFTRPSSMSVPVGYHGSAVASEHGSRQPSPFGGGLTFGFHGGGGAFPSEPLLG